MSFAEYAFVDRNGIDAHLAQTVYGRALYGMPVVEGHRTVSVDSTFAGYCDICALVCVDKGRVVEAFRSFPFSQYHRKVVGGFGREFQTCTLGDVQVDVTFQRNGSFDEIVSRGNQYGIASIGVTLIDGFQDGGTAVESCIVFCSVFGHIINRIGKCRRYDIF